MGIMPKVSVIMGVYNCKSFQDLARSVDSIIAQSYTDWEFIICDDGSDDGVTAAYLAQIKKRDHRIKILSYANNHGLAYALNYALSCARGEYIARTDYDDISHSERFAKQVKFLDENNEYSFVGSNANVFNGSGVWGALIMPEYPDKKSLLWNAPFIHPTMMFRKKDLLAVGGYPTDKVNRRCEDYTLEMDMYSRGYKGYNLQECLLDTFYENGARKYRPMKDRVAEARARFRGFKKNGILLQGIPFIVKPLLIGLIPQFVFRKIKHLQYRRTL